MYDQSLEQLIDAVIADGVITDQERKVVFKKAASLGIDQDEIEVYLEGKLSQLNSKGANMSSKYGAVRTCPNCGATLEGGNAKCPECGYTLSKIDANYSAKLLDERLRKARSSQRANIIRSFPIPNTREDLMEFLAALEPKALVRPSGSDEQKSETKAYYEKFVECLNKVRISFGDDSATKMFVNRFNNFNKKRKLMIWGITGTAIIIVVVIILSLSSYVTNRNEEQGLLRDEFQVWIENTKVEIEEYNSTLTSELNNIPKPTTKNWEECLDIWNRITWDKDWEVPKKFESIAKYGDHNLEYDTKTAFLNKKNAIGKQIATAEKRATGEEHFYHDFGM